MNDKPMVEMNANQRRGITVSLGLLDQALCEIRQWAEGREFQSVLYRERNDLSPQQRAKILTLIGEIQEIISDVKDSFTLNERIIEAVRSIRGHSSILWEQVLELQSRRLRRYGAVSPSLAEYLDPKVEGITQRLLHLSDVVSP